VGRIGGREEARASPRSGETEERLQPWSRGSLLHLQEKGSEGELGAVNSVGSWSRGSTGLHFLASSPYLLSWGSSRGTAEDHVWFEDQCMVASWCDE
jgi:hypothetical protein